MNAQEKGDRGKDRRLQDLLRRMEAGDLPDDFEREAADGFRALNEDEIYAAKESLDARAETLFSGAKKHRPAYWPLAAGVAFIIGLTVYFLKDDVLSEKQVAESKANTDAIISSPLSRPAPPADAEPKQDPSPPAATSARTEPQVQPKRKGTAQKTKKADPTVVQSADPAVISGAEAEKTETQNKNEKAPEPEVTPVAEADAAVTQEQEKQAVINSRKAVFAPPPASMPAQAGAEFSATGEALTATLYTHVRKALPARLHKQFDATVQVDSKGELSQFTIVEGSRLSDDESKEIAKLLNGTVAEAVATGKLVYESSVVTLRFRP